MKHLLITLIASGLLSGATAQTNHYQSLALMTTQNAYPFGKLSGLFSETIHPGFEIGMGKNINPKKNHEWFVELKLAYFFHRYVQHGIPVYLNFGYRRHINKKLSVETSLGAGYMHSIPATAKLKLNDNGDYENNKGIGRMQAMAGFGLGLGYVMHPSAARPIRLFTGWQQRVQMPFVKSYVPLLPYNSFIIGVSRPIKKK